MDTSAYTTIENTQTLLKNLVYTALFNTVIASFLYYLFRDTSFFSHFIISQCIGLSICSLCMASLLLLKPQGAATLASAIILSILVGGLLGSALGGRLAGLPVFDFTHRLAFSVRTLAFTILFGPAISFFFMARKKLTQTRQLAQQERMQRLISEKHAALAQLRMLQAQIEPHFLFNTLSNIQSLLDTDVNTGKAMLNDLTRYLRATLAGSRAACSTLQGEINLAAAYLNIYKVRMGERLKVTIDIADNLKQLSFAPMLIQPLVENAILHGIEPEMDGGAICITAAKADDRLQVAVMDTGRGFRQDQGTGLGLANIQQRLKALYGLEGKLILMENQPRGVKAVIEVPYAATL
jgi:signal transduction histidine kinase